MARNKYSVSDGEPSPFDVEAGKLIHAGTMKRAKAKQRAEGRARRVLTAAQVQKALTLDAESLEVLEAMSRGRAPRNAQSILGAIRLRLDFTAAKPKTEVEHSGGLSIQVNTLASPALPPPAAPPAPAPADDGEGEE